MSVRERPTFLYVSRPFMGIYGLNNSQMVKNAHETFTNVHANGQERLRTFEPGRSNALERIVENVHGTFTFQKRKKHCTISLLDFESF